jgi:hypothetical protein
MHLFVLYLSYDNAWSKLQKGTKISYIHNTSNRNGQESQLEKLEYLGLSCDKIFI